MSEQNEDKVEMEITLPDDLLAKVDALVETGLFPDRDSVIEMALRVMRDGDEALAAESAENAE